MFNLGDIVRVDFGNGEHEQVNGTFIHDRMRDLNGKFFRIVEAYAETNTYKLADANNNLLHWTFVSEWLVAEFTNRPGGNSSRANAGSGAGNNPTTDHEHVWWFVAREYNCAA